MRHVLRNTLLCLGGGLVAGTAAAQPIPAGFPANTGEAIMVGPFLFNPAVELKWEDNDNIFFQPVNKVHDHIYMARARLMFELPIYESYVRFAYTPQYREYKKYDLEHKWAHFADFNTVLEFQNGLRFRADYRFVNASQETSEVDAGGELLFVDELFTKHYAKVALDYWFSARDGFTIEGDYTDLKYDYAGDRPENIFYDYDRGSLGIGWLHQMSPILVMDVKYNRIQFDPVDTLTWRSYTSDQITVGFDGQFSPVVAAQLRVGWNETEYERSGGAPEFSDYSGPVIMGFINWELAHGSHLRLNLLRSPYPSNFENNAYYTATGGTLTYKLERHRVFGELFVHLQNNDYELPVVDPARPGVEMERSDDIMNLGLGLGYRFTNILSLRGTYMYEDRDTLFPYSYTINIWTLGLVIGY